MLTIRLQRIGRRNNPSYRVVVIESSVAAKKGKPVELLGQHDPIRKNTILKKDRILHWIGQGAQTSDTMHNILIRNGVIEGVKKNVLPKKNPIVKANTEGSAEEKSVSGNTEAQSEPVEDSETEQATDAEQKEVKTEDSTEASAENSTEASAEQKAEDNMENSIEVKEEPAAEQSTETTEDGEDDSSKTTNNPSEGG